MRSTRFSFERSGRSNAADLESIVIVSRISSAAHRGKVQRTDLSFCFMALAVEEPHLAKRHIVPACTKVGFADDHMVEHLDLE